MLKSVNQTLKKQFLVNFGKHIKALRQTKNMSQAQLAQRCFSAAKKIGRTERGEYDFKISSLIVLANGLHVDISELLDFDYPEGLFENYWTDKL